MKENWNNTLLGAYPSGVWCFLLFGKCRKDLFRRWKTKT